MESKNRASGWKHAKLSGHKNEELVKNLLDNNQEYANDFLISVGSYKSNLKGTSIGGIHETSVESVNGKRKTKSKTDLKIFLKSNDTLNISVKKSLSGQVYFVRAGLFIDTFEKQFLKSIPQNVKRAINLFWAESADAISIINNYAIKDSNFNMQCRRKSLNATTLKSYNQQLYNDLLTWFIENAYEIAKLCFSMGAVKDNNEWSDFIWYINLVGENDVDELFSIEEICKATQKNASFSTYYGDIHSGTTIQLPFGFVQWHQSKLQFHHNYNKIKGLLNQ